VAKITANDLLEKLRRAHRNETGAHFSNEELRALAEFGALHMLANAEADEIIATWTPEQPTAPDADPDVFSVRTLADRWQCSEGLVRNMINRGELRAFRFGNMLRIRLDAVEEIEAKRG